MMNRRDENPTRKQRVLELPNVESACPPRNEVWKIKVTGTPTGGDFDLTITVGNTPETITINYDDSAADVKTAFATHTNLTSSDLDTAGGPLPGTEVTVEFIGDYERTLIFKTADDAPRIDDTGLTGGTGASAWVIPMIPGHPRNANP